MGYRHMETSEIYDLYRRWHEGSSISSICAEAGTDRKTIRKYVNRILKAGFTRQAPLETKELFFATIGNVQPKLQRVQGVRGLLIPFKEESEILSIVVDEETERPFGQAADSSTSSPFTNFLPASTRGTRWNPMSFLQLLSASLQSLNTIVKVA